MMQNMVFLIYYYTYLYAQFYFLYVDLAPPKQNYEKTIFFGESILLE